MNDYKFETHFKEIKNACFEKINITFIADKKTTCFQTNEAPLEWTEFPPCFSTKEEFEKVFAMACLNATPHQVLIQIVLITYYTGGKVSYKYQDENHVNVKLQFS